MTFRLSIIAKNGSCGSSTYATLEDARANLKSALGSAMMDPKVKEVILRDSKSGNPLYMWPPKPQSADKPRRG